MKLVTLADGTKDGRLAVASRDLVRAIPAEGVARTLQDAIERWSEVEPGLRALANRVEFADAAGAVALASEIVLAPLPRAWQWLDGSTFESHDQLMSLAFNVKPKGMDAPLMYQGLSDQFLSPTEDVPFPSEEHGIDFEGEMGVIVDEVPMGTTAEDAAKYIRLLVQINDWSLRALAVREFEIGFGWVHAKPPCSLAPAAVTIDELGDAWKDGRITLPLTVDWNGKRFGNADAAAMKFSFPEIIAHAARTRRLVAGTILGSGTVSNANFREIGSSCIAERRGIEILDEGKASTNFMRFGDRVRMEVLHEGRSVFGAIDQKVVQA